MSLDSLENDQEYLNLQTELIHLQLWMKSKGKRLLIIFEGRDTAGKGSAIMKFVRYLNPRHYRIVALPKPTEIEMGQWYFQRYIKEFPNPGEIVLFDRSWYNRAVVEPVMEFCTPLQYERFIKQVVQLERMLSEDDLPIIKFWFSIDREEQQERLLERKTSPLKNWKLSTVDALAQEKFADFTTYKDEMFRLTSTVENPWIVLDGNNKMRARKEAMRYVLSTVEYDEKGSTGERLTPDPKVVKKLT